MKKYLIKAEMTTNLYLEVEANSEEDVQRMIDHGEIDGGDMKQDAHDWSWTDITEIKGEL